MILERLDFKIMITVAGGLLMAASLLMCFIICLSYKVTKSMKGEKMENVTSNDADKKDKKPALEAGQPEVPPTPASKPR